MSKINKIKLSGTTYDIQDLSATSVVNVTQAEYDALVTGGTVDPTTLYNITDAQAGDLSQYWTSAQTNSAITQAVSGKQDTLSAGTGISISGNVISATGGGGKAIEAGRGITVTSGETADTVSFNLPIYSGTNLDGSAAGAESIRFSTQTSLGSSAGLRSIRGRFNSNALGEDSICFGINSFVRGFASFGVGRDFDSYGDYATIFGYGTNTKNNYETAIGKHNTSNSGSTDADKTLFSVGNGTADNARHNAFEIRQNGDIYISSGGTDIKLQDNLGSGGGGGGKAIEAGRGIEITTSESADTINCTVPASASSGNYSIMFGQPASSGDASGPKTITGGQWSKAFSEGAVSIGQMNEARGQWAWAIGNGTKTNGKAAFACGERTSANAQYAFSEGTETSANTQASHAAGSYTSTKNRSEFSIGEYNNSVSASTTFGDSGNTLFSVGNGTADNARHNAFEIRQNGDIYLNDGSKLQNTVSATASNTAALGGLKLVKLSQSEYDALATKDSNTLYIVTDS